MTSFGITRRTLAAAAATLAVALAAPATATAQHHGGGAHGAAATNGRNLVQVATEAGSFKTLLAAVNAAGLAETLQGEGPFTVFAPSDAAFAKLPAGTVESLLADPAALRSVLTFHVVSGRIAAADVVQAGSATPRTVNGQTLDVRVRDGKVYVNGAQVVAADVAASNGVIHVIDTVLLPASAPGGR